MSVANVIGFKLICYTIGYYVLIQAVVKRDDQTFLIEVLTRFPAFSARCYMYFLGGLIGSLDFLFFWFCDWLG